MSFDLIAFWIVAVALAGAVAATLLRAIWRAGDGDRSDADLQVYRDQLAEVDRDLARGVLTEADAEQVRIEVSRRLLAADRASGTETAPRRGPARTLQGLVLIVAVAGPLGLYGVMGSPDYPDQPIGARLEAAREIRETRPSQTEVVAGVPSLEIEADAGFLELMDKLRAALVDRPDDLEGYELLARNETNLGNFSAAAEAKARVIALKGPRARASDHSERAELLIFAAGGYVSPEAEAELQAALDRDPEDAPARYYLGLMFAQTDRPDLAFRLWDKLLRGSPAGAPWVASVRAALPELAARAGERYAPPPVPGPTSGSNPSASLEMGDDERAAMIGGMVEGLAERLGSEGGPPEDWAKLVRALGVLGETQRAGAIWIEAQEVFADLPDALAQIRAEAVAAGVAE